MPTTTTTEGPNLPGWGVDKTIDDKPTHIITDWETALEPQSAYCYDSKGAVVHRQDYDAKTTVTCTLMAPADEAMPNKDDRIAVGGVAFAVLSARLIQNNRDFQKVALTLESYENWPKSGK